MVPAADILNHIANHNANLEYSAVSEPLGLVMCIESNHLAPFSYYRENK